MCFGAERAGKRIARERISAGVMAKSMGGDGIHSLWWVLSVIKGGQEAGT